MAGQEGSAGLIGKAELSGQMDFGSSASSAAGGGRIDNGPVFNSSSAGGLGLVKTLAYAGIAFVFWRLIFGKK